MKGRDRSRTPWSIRAQGSHSELTLSSADPPSRPVRARTHTDATTQSAREPEASLGGWLQPRPPPLLMPAPTTPRLRLPCAQPRAEGGEPEDVLRFSAGAQWAEPPLAPGPVLASGKRVAGRPEHSDAHACSFKAIRCHTDLTSGSSRFHVALSLPESQVRKLKLGNQAPLCASVFSSVKWG